MSLEKSNSVNVRHCLRGKFIFGVRHRQSGVWHMIADGGSPASTGDHRKAQCGHCTNEQKILFPHDNSLDYLKMNRIQACEGLKNASLIQAGIR
jgi:hypothetical protein